MIGAISRCLFTDLPPCLKIHISGYRFDESPVNKWAILAGIDGRAWTRGKFGWGASNPEVLVEISMESRLRCEGSDGSVSFFRCWFLFKSAEAI